MNTTQTTESPRTETRALTEAARCAKDIRGVLKAAFPGCKFKVTSSNFSMGDSVTIKWVDGPSSGMVDDQVMRFRDGSFDGMTDSYDYASKDATTPNRAKYVSTSRDYSEGLRERVAADLRALFAGSDHEIERETHSMLYRADLTASYRGLVRSVHWFEIATGVEASVAAVAPLFSDFLCAEVAL